MTKITFDDLITKIQALRQEVGNVDITFDNQQSFNSSLMSTKELLMIIEAQITLRA